VKKEKKEGDQGEDRNKKSLLIIDDDVDITNSFNLALEDSGLFVVGTYIDV
jgi:DNA-binding NtrC family response regulator